MKLSCIRISPDILIGKKQDEIIGYLSKKLLGIGLPIQSVVTTLNNPNNLFDTLNFSNSDIVIIIGEATSSKNYNIKKAISTYLNLEISKNNESITNVKNFYNSQNTPMSVDSENEYYLPNGAILLSSKYTHMQGFIIKGNKTIIFLPDNLDFITDVYSNYLNNYLLDIQSIKYNVHIIKLYGIYDKDIYSILNDLIKNIYKILIVTYSYDLEVSLHVRYNSNTDEDIIRSFLSKIYDRLSKYIYADEDVTLAERANDMLNLSNIKIAIVEGSTYGMLTQQLSSCANYKNETIIETIIGPSIDTKIKTLGISESIINKYGNDSVETVYEMAVHMLNKTNADIVVATSGNIFDNSNNSKNSFIAIGNNDGLHVYKSNFIGTKNQIISSITQTALFYLIKNIKQNDWILMKNTI